MSFYASRRSKFSNACWILLVTIVYFYPQQLEATITEPDADGENSFASSDEEASGNNEFDASTEDEDFERLLRTIKDQNDEFSTNYRLARDELPENLRRFLNLYEVDESRKFNDDLTNDAEIRLKMLNEKPIDLPKRFSYIAREFYKTLEIPSRTKDVPDTVDGEQKDEKKVQVDVLRFKNIVENNGKNEPALKPKNIIGAPIRGCQPGQRKDHLGRCRKVLW